MFPFPSKEVRTESAISTSSRDRWTGICRRPLQFRQTLVDMVDFAEDCTCLTRKEPIFTLSTCRVPRSRCLFLEMAEYVVSMSGWNRGERWEVSVTKSHDFVGGRTVAVAREKY
ncbi:hypothetical protein LshimejAT787_0113010 [Lyophyllum shimeji]|uniref:Uncharacterized protein n=1 Tax=Lyophyllum shimeji TaxID=47721 RepID=A0A9P3PEF5_LYOSH|nr:hypothetical protein LshimejAT787_0113010 [Lyophyllum shimeji]